MINKFISGLSSNEKKLLTVASLAVLTALFFGLLFFPSMDRLKQIDGSIAKEELAIQRNVHFLGYRDRVIKEASIFKDFYSVDVLAEEEVIADFFKKIEVMATKAKVELSKISPAGQAYEENSLKYFVTMDCSGKFDDITNFIYAVNSAKELLRVEKMNIVGNARDLEKVTANLTISKMVIGADPSVDAKALIKPKAESPATAAEPVKK